MTASAGDSRARGAKAGGEARGGLRVGGGGAGARARRRRRWAAALAAVGALAAAGALVALGAVGARGGALLGAARALVRRGLRWYARVLHYYPLSSRAVSAGVIFLAADAWAQVLGARGRKWFCWVRLVRYGGYGLVVMGPFLWVWYSAMNVLGPEDDVRGALLKAAFEQATLEPACIALYMVYDGAVCARGPRATLARLRASFWPLYVKNAIFWLPANFSNYYIGTPDLRVLFANLCSLFWNVYFSAKVNTAPPKPASPAPTALPLYARAPRQRPRPALLAQLLTPQPQPPAQLHPPQPLTQPRPQQHPAPQAHPAPPQQQLRRDRDRDRDRDHERRVAPSISAPAAYVLGKHERDAVPRESAVIIV